MRILIDLQPLQTLAAASRGVGRYTNGLLSALASFHDVVGMRRACPYLVPPSADVRTVEIPSGISETELEQQLLDWHFDVVINCSGPFWEENVIISGLRNTARPIVASIFYDVIPWVFPDVYLKDPQVRRGYHNRCVDLYARADLVCAISQHSERDALRFGYATHETATTISLGVPELIPESANAREKWKIPRSYLLSVSGDEFRKNPEMLIVAFLQSNIRKSRCLVIIISNDADSGFSHRMEAKYGNLRAQGVIILPEVTESELGALYRDCDALVYTSLYEGFGIPIVEAMRFGKWIISSRSSSLAEVSGRALFSVIEDPSDVKLMILALNQAAKSLDEEFLDESIPRDHAQGFSWARVVRNFEDAVMRRHKALALKPSSQISERPRLFWASPFPNDVSGIAFYSEDLVGPVSKNYDIILVPNTVSTFVPTPKTGRFKIEEARAEALLALCNGEQPFVFYNMGNSHFHLELLDLLFTLPGIVLLHDSFVEGIERLWRERNGGLAMDQNFTTMPAATPGLRRWCRTLSKVDRLLNPVQPTRLRRTLSMIARLPGMRRLVLDIAEFLRVAAAGSASRASIEARAASDNRSLHVKIIESSWAMLFLGEHAKSLIGLEHLAKRPTHVVPLYCRYRGGISATKRAELRRKYGIAEDAFVVTTTGFQSSIKLTDRIVQGCVELKDFENALVYVQVLGHFFESALKDKVTALLKKNDVRAFVSDGFVDEETLAQRVALSDVAVFLRGWTTGGPSAGLNDALGMGIPGLVTDDFAFREYPKTAVLHVSNIEVTEGLIRLYRHPEMRQTLAAGGLQYAQDMSLERVAARLCKIFSLYRRDRLARPSGEGTRERAGQAAANVFVDITYGLMHKARSGLQRVEREIACGLRELDPCEEYFTFVAWQENSHQFHIVSLDHLMQRESLPPLETWLSRCPRAEIGAGAHLFILGSNWPLGDQYFTDVLTLTRRGVQISVLIPDLIPIRHRWDFYAHHPAGTMIDYFRAFCLQVVPLCKNILTISNYCMADIQKLLLDMECSRPEKNDAPKTYALVLGADWTAPIVDAASFASGTRGRIVENPYILCVSTLEYRKNHKRLLEAFAEVRRHVKNVDLVLVGGIDSSISEGTLEFCRSNLWVHHFERVDDTTLGRLYEDCLFSVYPSLDEGYGLPVIESFRYRKFCLASHAGAIPEAGGKFADYFDPYSVHMLIQKILMYVGNPEELQRRQKLLELYKPTSWRETAWQVAQIFYGDTASQAFVRDAEQG